MTGRWLHDASLGVRLALAGGRGAWIRTVLTALGVGLGVALLLLAASFPNALHSRDARSAAWTDSLSDSLKPSDTTLLVGRADTTFRQTGIRGRLLQADGDHPVLPPGVARLPRPGEVVISPKLHELLGGPGGELLRARLPRRVIGTIGDAGLAGPGEAAFYAGSDRLRADRNAGRTDRFGALYERGPFDPILALLVNITLVVLLLPVAVFVAAAARFGSEERDRRLAALRLVGADGHMVRRIAAGESLVGAAAGLGVGTGFFLLARQLVPHLSVGSLSLFAADVRPSAPLAALIAISVPLLAVVVTQAALSRIAIDPLGVVRRGRERRRRVLWRVLVPLAGVLLLLPLLTVHTDAGERFDPFQTAAGVVLVLVGITALLPWAVEAAVRRMDGRRSVAWQLAVRRLQLDTGTSARIVSGIAVAVAGAIALQTLFGTVTRDRTYETGVDMHAVQVQASFPAGIGRADVGRRLAATPGVRSVVTWAMTSAIDRAGNEVALAIADCATLRRMAVIGACGEGDAFHAGNTDGPPTGRAGNTLTVDRDRAATLTLPASTHGVALRPVVGGMLVGGVLLTPGAAAHGIDPAAATAYASIALERVGRDDALERVRNTAVALAPTATVVELGQTTDDRDLNAIRTAITAGAICVLVLIAASMVVSALEQLNARRRLLAALVALGTPQGTLHRSVLLQTAVPVVLGLALALVTGVGLGAFLLRLIGEPVRFSAGPLLGILAAGLAVVPVVTLLTAPALRRLTRPDGLRME
ncbi:MAG: FtsX-like permease family protein [Conexibacter sp.]